MVSGICNRLLYGTGICCNAFYIYNLYFLWGWGLGSSVHFFFFFKYGIDKSDGIVDDNNGSIEGTISWKNLCLMLVYVCFVLYLCRD